MTKITISDNILKNKAYETARNCKYDGYQKALASVVSTCLDKKAGSGVSVNEQLDEELGKPVIKKFKKRNIYARFKGNIWAAHLAEMGSSSSKNKNAKYLLCVIYVSIEYSWVKQLAQTVLHAFLEIANESNCKLNKLWIDQGR